MRRLLIFEDQQFDQVNDLFLMHLHDQLDCLKVNIEQAINVREFERKATVAKRDILVLDIMAAAPPGFTWIQTGSDVPSSLVGVELLYRCRNGIYGDNYKHIPIFMRTARGEADIRHYCMQAGATECFDPGADDQTLIAAIKDWLATPTLV
jgi:CheY-like chemotaxis protein